MEHRTVHEMIDEIVRNDRRYDREAYLFVRDGLDRTLELLGSPPAGKGPPRHVSGQQLLDGLRVLALERFGPLARTVLDHWGVRVCEDFGEIVFSMIDAGILGKNATDKLSDFAGRYDFHKAFDLPFVPAAKRPAADMTQLTSPCQGQPDKDL